MQPLPLTVRALQAEEEGLRIARCWSLPPPGGWVEEAEAWFEHSSGAALHTLTPDRDTPSARELVWLALARTALYKLPGGQRSAGRVGGWTEARSRLATKKVITQCTTPALLAYIIDFAARDGAADPSGGFAQIAMAEAVVVEGLWDAPEQAARGAPGDFPLQVVADCARSFYWMRVLARLVRRASVWRDDGDFEAAAATALEAVIMNRDSNARVEQLAKPWVTRLQGALDMESGYRRRAAFVHHVDIDALLHTVSDDEEVYKKIVARIKHNPGVPPPGTPASSSPHAGPLSTDEMSQWVMAAWCFAFSQVCTRPLGVPPSFDTFAEWYFVSFGDIGTDRHRRVAAFSEARNGSPPRPYICHAAERIWLVVSPSGSPKRCASAISAIAAWVHTVHADFEGFIETGQKIGSTAAWFFS